jgi:hypothetical protein
MVSYQIAAGRKKPKVHPLVRWASQLFDAQQKGPDSRQMPHAKIAKVLCSRISLPNCAGKTVLVQRPQLYVGAEMTLFLFSHMLRILRIDLPQSSLLACWSAGPEVRFASHTKNM